MEVLQAIFKSIAHLQQHIFPLLGLRPISTVNRKDCRLLVTTVRSKGLAITTVRGIVRALSVVLSQAVEAEHLSANPALSMRKYLRRGDEPAPTMDPFTRDSFASLLLQAGEPITYVSKQLGHRDSAITLQVYAHWMPDASTRKGVDRLDDFSPAVAHSLHTTLQPALRRTA